MRASACLFVVLFAAALGCSREPARVFEDLGPAPASDGGMAAQDATPRDLGSDSGRRDAGPPPDLGPQTPPDAGASAGSCSAPGTFVMASATRWTYSGTIDGSSVDGWESFCSIGGGGREVMATWTAPASGFATFEATGVLGFLSVAENCADIDTELDCDFSTGTPASVFVDVTAGTTYYAIFDGLSAASQGGVMFTITIEGPIERGGACLAGIDTCVTGLVCAPADTGTSTICRDPLARGDRCRDTATAAPCPTGDVCAPDAAGVDRCRAPLADGDRCRPTSTRVMCPSGLICAQNAMMVDVCRGPLVVGDRCTRGSTTAPCPAMAVCAPDVAMMSTTTCQAVTTVPMGGACVPGSVVQVCAAGTFCQPSAGGTTCQTVQDLGCGATTPVVVLDSLLTNGRVRFAGTTMGGVNHQAGACGTSAAATAPDVIHKFTLPYDAEVTASTTMPGWDAILYARTQCTMPTTELACSDPGSLTSAQLGGLVPAGTTLFFFVDGFSTGSGDYELEVTARRVRNAGETCDPLRVADRCVETAPVCAPPAAGGAPVCRPSVTDSGCGMGAALADITSRFDSNGVAVVSGNTAGLGSRQLGACESGSSSTGEILHKIVLPYAAEVRIETTATWRPVTYVRTDCTMQMTERACSSSGAIDYTELGSVAAGTTLYVVVDGTSATASGPYTLTVRLRRAAALGEACDVMPAFRRCDVGLACRANVCATVVCGDGMREGAEICDDMNTMAGDGCSPTCTVEDSGPGGEACASVTDLRLVSIGTGLRRATAMGTTETSANDFMSGAGCGSGSAGGDRAYRFTLARASDVAIQLTPGAGFNAILQLRDGACTDMAAGGLVSSGCLDSGGPGSAEGRTFANLPAGTYVIVVDGRAATPVDGGVAVSGGPYVLNVSVQER